MDNNSVNSVIFSFVIISTQILQIDRQKVRECIVCMTASRPLHDPTQTEVKNVIPNIISVALIQLKQRKTDVVL